MSKDHQPVLGSDYVGEALGNGRPSKDEEVRIGENSHLHHPVTEEAFEYLIARRDGTHPLMNFLPIFLLRYYSEALGRQIRADEIPLFVGLDGEINSAVCAQKLHWRGVKIDDKISCRQRRLERELLAISDLPDMYTEDDKAKFREDLRQKAEKELIELENQKTSPNFHLNCCFTPVSFVDPRLNSRLCEHLRDDGDDVKEIFMRGDMQHGIIRSGCYFLFRNGGISAFSGSPWFYNKETRQVSIATSPLGQASIRHPRAGNSQSDIERYLKGEPVHLRTHWGISSFEIKRRERLSEMSGDRPNEHSERVEVPDFMEELLLGVD